MGSTICNRRRKRALRDRKGKWMKIPRPKQQQISQNDGIQREAQQEQDIVKHDLAKEEAAEAHHEAAKAHHEAANKEAAEAHHEAAKAHHEADKARKEADAAHTETLELHAEFGKLELEFEKRTQDIAINNDAQLADLQTKFERELNKKETELNKLKGELEHWEDVSFQHYTDLEKLEDKHTKLQSQYNAVQRENTALCGVIRGDTQQPQKAHSAPQQHHPHKQQKSGKGKSGKGKSRRS